MENALEPPATERVTQVTISTTATSPVRRQPALKQKPGASSSGSKPVARKTTVVKRAPSESISAKVDPSRRPAYLQDFASLLELTPAPDREAIEISSPAISKAALPKPKSRAFLANENGEQSVPSVAAPKPKRTKPSDLDAAVVLAKVLAKQASGLLMDLSIAEIQCYLRSRKQPVSGKKAELLNRLAAILNHT